MTRGPTRASVGRAVRRISYVFAVLFVGAAAVLLAPLSPADAGGATAAGETASTGSGGVLVSLPVVALAFACSVVARAVATRSASDAVLAAFSTPCLLAAIVSLSVVLSDPGGVAWGGAASFLAGTLLGVVVLADAALERLVDRRVATGSS